MSLIRFIWMAGCGTWALLWAFAAWACVPRPTCQQWLIIGDHCLTQGHTGSWTAVTAMCLLGGGAGAAALLPVGKRRPHDPNNQEDVKLWCYMDSDGVLHKLPDPRK